MNSRGRPPIRQLCRNSDRDNAACSPPRRSAAPLAADEDASSYGAPVIPRCPMCGSPGVPLLFGLPIEEARRAARDGRLALGGCFLSDEDPPNWECRLHHRWRHGLEEDQQMLIIDILKTYGYDDDLEDE